MGSSKLAVPLKPFTKPSSGFTLVELGVVLFLMALGAGLVIQSMRSSPRQHMEKEAYRLASVLENAKALARTTGRPMVWQTDAKGFSIKELDAEDGKQQTFQWLSEGMKASPAYWVISPEPVQAAKIGRAHV